MHLQHFKIDVRKYLPYELLVPQVHGLNLNVVVGMEYIRGKKSILSDTIISLLIL